MRRMHVRTFVVLLTLLAGLAAAVPIGAGQSAYAGEETRRIKALSPERIAGYLEGRGMGQARAAELNGYPGPKHVLELADRLTLTDAQRQRTRELFERMHAAAVELGQRIVELESGLDAGFAAGEMDADTLKVTLDEISVLEARLRGVHLEAHLEQARILTPNQIRWYARLRGYESGESGPPRAGGHEHGH